MHPRTRATRRIATATVAGAALIATTAGLAAPALAERAEVTDPADARASHTDIREAVVDHRVERLLVKVRFTDLRKKSDAGGAGIGIFLDADASEPGPEFKLSGGLQRGTDYQLMRVEDWKVVGEPLSCRHRVTHDYAADLLRFRAARPCLDDPAEVRVAVKMTDLYDASHPVTDWLRGPRKFTRWLASG